MKGTELSRKLGVSRATIHRLVDSLKSKGFIIEAYPGRGYKLIIENDLQTLTNTSWKLHGLCYKIYYIRECTSTQDIAEELAKSGAPEGSVIVAEKQTRGRGRFGREWFSGEGGLWFTVLLKPKVVNNLQLVSLAMGTAVAESIKKLLKINVGLKWPNDVLYGKKKLAGILVEGKVEADVIKYILVGVGINVNNELPSMLRDKATSISEILGFKVPRAPILKGILASFSKYYESIVRGEHEHIIKEWKKHTITLYKKVIVKFANEVIKGIATGIGKDGSLIIRCSDGSIRKAYAGDCTILE